MEDTNSSIQFSASDALSKAWLMFKKDWLMLISLTLITSIISLAFYAVTQADDSQPQTAKAFYIFLLLTISSWIVQSLLNISWTTVFLRSSRSLSLSLSDVFSRWPRILSYLGAYMLSGIIIGVGFLLFIIPGIIWSIKYMFVTYLIVDKNIGIKESLKKSEVMTEGIKWKLIGFGIMMSLVNVVGFLALGVGLLVTLPLTTLAHYILYNQLLQRIEETPADKLNHNQH